MKIVLLPIVLAIFLSVGTSSCDEDTPYPNTEKGEYFAHIEDIILDDPNNNSTGLSKKVRVVWHTGPCAYFLRLDKIEHEDNRVEANLIAFDRRLIDSDIICPQFNRRDTVDIDLSRYQGKVKLILNQEIEREIIVP